MLQLFEAWADSLDGYDLLSTDIEILQDLWIQMIDDRKGAAVLPQEVDQIPLAEDTNHIVCSLLGDQNAMCSSSEELDGRRQVRGFWKHDKWRLLRQGQDVVQWYWLSLTC